LFYPALLSLAWRWNPSFPGSLGAAFFIEALFVCLALLVTFLLLRSLNVSTGAALGMTAFCAFEPVFMVLGAKLLTDVPMMTLTLAAALFAERALDKAASWWVAPLAGALAAAAILTRTIGVTVVGAVLLMALARRRFRPALIFLAVCLPLVAAGLLGPGNNAQLQTWSQQGGAGFQQNWLFYTSYL